MSRIAVALAASLSVVLASTVPASAADAPAIAAPSGAVQVLRITPDGDTNSDERQVVVQFDRPMVVLGSVPPKLESAPVSISPGLQCNWHWVNTSTLACELGEQGGLKPATSYSVLVHAGIKAVDGNTLEKDAAGAFTTEKPRADYGFVRDWSGPTLPVVQVDFNLPVTKGSVEAHLYFTSSAGRTPVSVAADPNDYRDYYVIPSAGGEPVHVPARERPRRHVQEEGDEEGDEEGGATPAPAEATVAAAPPAPAGEEARYHWLVSVRPDASPALPGGDEVSLDQEAGFRSPLGPEAGDGGPNLGNFYTFRDFQFLGMSCGQDDTDHLDQGNTPSSMDCDPQRYVGYDFTAPVTREELAAHAQVLVGGKSVDTVGDMEGDYAWREGRRNGPPQYSAYLPGPMKANADYVVKVTAGMKDIWGRPLKQGGSAHFHTDHRQPALDLQEDVSVLESGVDSEVPLYFTNIDKLTASYTTYVPYAPPPATEKKGVLQSLKDMVGLGSASAAAPATAATPSADGSMQYTYKLPAVQDLSVGIPLDVRRMLQGKSGAVWGTLDSEPDTDRREPIRFFSQVTPFSVTVKVGHYNTLVWVTDFATGQPVLGARVDIYRGTSGGPPDAADDKAHASTDISGVATLPGGDVLDPDLSLRGSLWDYGDRNPPRLVVKVTRGVEQALMPLNNDFHMDAGEVSHYKLWEQPRKHYGHVHTWGTTAEGIYRAGDTIQYKIYVRDQDNQSFVAAPAVDYSVWLVDPMGNVVDRHDGVRLSAFGAYDGEYKVPENAPVGWYRFQISSDKFPDGGGSNALEPMSVLVSDFTPAPFHVDASLNGARFQPGDKVEVTTVARLHSGGPYTGAQGRVTVNLKADEFESADPAAQDFSFSGYDEDINEHEQTVNQTSGDVDDSGTLKAGFTLDDAGVYYGKLMVEGAVRDERGKYISGITRAEYMGRDRYVGLKLKGWVFHAKEAGSVDYLVVGTDGKPVAGSNVDIKVERMDVKAARVKGPGNAYLTQYNASWVAAGGCQAVSAAVAASCSFTPDQPGSYRIKASVTDTHGRVHSSSLPAWVVGAGEVVWEDKDDGALTVIPEKAGYKVGDTARYLVQNPYPGAKALITVERYGVLKSWVQTLEGSTPIVSFPVEQDFVPGFFLSITVVSPRVARPLGPGEVDLGKPAFRVGYLQVPVVDDYKVMDVKIATPKDSYKPRDKVEVSIDAKARHGQAGDVELAVAVLDDSVFDLLSEGKDYFDPYKGFYKVDGLDLQNFDLIRRLVGRQSFEKKGANPGGDGGAAVSLRSLFKFVSYWNPALKPDASGKARFTFEVPDNLTAWRVLVLAVNKTDRMGLGDYTFKVNRPTELRPVMPNQVVEGDRFDAGFSVMNRTDKPRDLKVHVSVKGSVVGAPVLDQVVHVDPYKRVQVWLPVQTAGAGALDFTATAGDAVDADGLKQSVPVQRRTTLVSLAQYGTATGPVTEPVQYPTDAVPDTVRLGVNLTPTVIGNLQGAFRYMSEYPYECWEQRLTKAVMAANYKRLRPYLGKDSDWSGSEGIPDATLAAAAAFQAPNGGMTYWVADNRYVDPYLSAYTALAFNWLRAQGYAVPQAVEQRLHGYLQAFLKGDGVPDWYSLGMRSSVRAVALAALAADKEATFADLQRFEPHLKEMSLFGQAWFLQAALQLDGQDLATESLKLILNHANETAGKFEFSEALDDGYSRILSTPMRSNCVILTALSQYAKHGQAYAAAVQDMPFKLVRSITAIRGGRTHWENTQENLFCMQALADYADAYEKTPPDLQVGVSVGTAAFGSAQFKSLSDAPKLLSQPFAPGPSGVSVPVTMAAQGQGRFYYKVQLDYAPATLPTSINDGIEIRREYSVQRDGKWQLLKSPMRIQRGELVRVDLYVSVPAAREFVVVDDPVPGGLEPVDRNLATSSGVDADAGKFQAAGGAFWFNFDDWEDYGVQFWDFYHQELRHDSARFYADYLPGGHYHLSYSAQAIATGSFAVQPPKAMEMYDTDVFGLDASAVLEVAEPAPAAP